MQPTSSPPVAHVSRTVDKRTDFFIAGNSKSGTSALYFFLNQHPEICMSSPKEPNFFATDFCHDQDMGAFTRKSASDYRGFFDDPTGTRLRGEASACYLYSKEAAANIAAYNPEARIIAIFREPVSFLHSYHLQQLKNPVSEGETVKDFETALTLESDRRAGKSIPAGCLIPELLFYSERIKYADHLGRFYDHFPREQVLVLFYEDFKADNQAVYKEILEFVGVAPDHQPTFRRHNAGQKLKSKTAQRFVHRLSHGTGGWAGPKKLLKGLLPQFVRRFLLRTAMTKVVFEPKDTVSPELRKRLMRSFKPEVIRFGKLIGRDVSARWGYDSI
jgi:hypothetical protein